VEIFVAVHKISFANKAFDFLLGTFLEVKFEIKAIEPLVNGAFKWARKSDRLALHPHMLNIFIIAVSLFWILA
jgi:hypothetical protein